MHRSGTLFVLITLLTGALTAPIKRWESDIDYGNPKRVTSRGNTLELEYREKLDDGKPCAGATSCNIVFKTRKVRTTDEDWGNPDLVTYKRYNVEKEYLQLNYGSSKDRPWCDNPGSHFYCFVNDKIVIDP